MFSANRIKLIVDKLLPCLKEGFIRSEENVILNNIPTYWMALVLVCPVMFYRTLNCVADGITTFVDNDRWCGKL